jgi:hypothetical protein
VLRTDPDYLLIAGKAPSSTNDPADRALFDSIRSGRPEGCHVRVAVHFDVRIVKCYDVLMVVKPSRLRANLYRLLDHVLRTGEPIEIDRGGKKLLIVSKEKPARLTNLVRREVIVGDPEDLVHVDWSKEWRGDLP